MFFNRKKMTEDIPKDITRDKIDTILDILIGLTPTQFKNLKAGMDSFYEGYTTIKGVKTKEERAAEQEAKENAEIENIENRLNKIAAEEKKGKK